MLTNKLNKQDNPERIADDKDRSPTKKALRPSRDERRKSVRCFDANKFGGAASEDNSLPVSLEKLRMINAKRAVKNSDVRFVAQLSPVRRELFENVLKIKHPPRMIEGDGQAPPCCVRPAQCRRPA